MGRAATGRPRTPWHRGPSRRGATLSGRSSPSGVPRSAQQVAGDASLDRLCGLLREERLRERQLPGRAPQVALLDEGEERVLEDGLAHRLGPLDLAAEEHPLADVEGAAHEVLVRE